MVQVACEDKLSIEDASSVVLEDMEVEDRAALIVGVRGVDISVDGAVTVLRTTAEGEEEAEDEPVLTDIGSFSRLVNGAVTVVRGVAEEAKVEVTDNGEIADEVVCDETGIVFSWTGAPWAGAGPPKSATSVMFTW